MSSSPRLIGLVALALPLAVRAALVRRGITTNPSDLTSYTYDYVIVGGGSAGLAVASLLSADSSVSVAVIEAGGLGQDVYDRVMIPALTYLEGVSVPGSQYDWGYFASGLNRTLHWPRGKILGGSSAINAEYAVRASKLEHDAWASLNPGANTDWSWDGLYPYMYATENYHPPSNADIAASNIKVDDSHHNSKGPIHVSYPYYRYDQVNLWVPTLANLGVDTRDPSQGEGWGAYITPNTIDPSTATRSYSKTGYLDPASGRSNLAVLLGHQATRISFGAKGENGQPKPDYVEFAQAANGTRYQVKVNKEVILCGGVIGTPQLLQLSGIGPKAVLDSFKIPTVVDLPGVGEHLQDHILVPVVWSTNASVTGDAAAVSDEVKAQQTALFKAGFFSDTLFSAANNAIAYINLKQLMGNDGAAKFMQEVKANQSSILAFYNTTEASVKAGYKLTHDVEVNNILDSNVGVIELLMGNTGTFNPSAKTLAIQASIQHPFARGNVVLNSTNPFMPPAITTNYLTSEADLIILREGVKYARKVGQTAPLSSILTEELQPGPEVISDQDLDQFILNTAGTQYHPASTSSQLPRDKGGVVDTELKVYGVDGLRVIDSSIIPIGLCAHLVMPTYAIAEKGAGIILNRAPPSANSGAPPKSLISTNLILISFSIIYFLVA